jgi:hypothetical protein
MVTVAASATMAYTGAYVFIDLYRWEWNRAAISGIMFVAVEVFFVSWLLTRRLRSIERDSPDRRDRIRSRLRQHPAKSPVTFEWVRPNTSRTYVFVPLLMGAGVLLTGLGWVVERLGAATAGAGVDSSAVTVLARLGPPPGGLLDDSGDPLATLRGPIGGSR